MPFLAGAEDIENLIAGTDGEGTTRMRFECPSSQLVGPHTDEGMCASLFRPRPNGAGKSRQSIEIVAPLEIVWPNQLLQRPTDGLRTSWHVATCTAAQD